MSLKDFSYKSVHPSENVPFLGVLFRFGFYRSSRCPLGNLSPQASPGASICPPPSPGGFGSGGGQSWGPGRGGGLFLPRLRPPWVDSTPSTAAPPLPPASPPPQNVLSLWCGFPSPGHASVRACHAETLHQPEDSADFLLTPIRENVSIRRGPHPIRMGLKCLLLTRLHSVWLGNEFGEEYTIILLDKVKCMSPSNV